MKKAARKKASARKRPAKKWSREVMRKSDALDLEPEIFKSAGPAGIARSLRHSAEKSKRRKAGPFQSAMSMLNFYINRGGSKLPAAKKKTLEKAKDELRRLYKRPLKK